MNTLNDIMDKLKKSGVLIVFGVLSFYFTINAIKGDRGFFKYLYLNFQISLLYSSIVLSDEKKPAFAIFTSIMRFHFASSL